MPVARLLTAPGAVVSGPATGSNSRALMVLLTPAWCSRLSTTLVPAVAVTVYVIHLPAVHSMESVPVRPAPVKEMLSHRPAAS